MSSSDQSRPVEAADGQPTAYDGRGSPYAIKKSHKDQKFPQFIRSAHGSALLANGRHDVDTQHYNVNDPRPYDDTGWTLGALRNVKTVRVTDKGILEAPATLLTSDARVRGKLVGSESPAGYVINHNTENTLATLRFRLKDVKMSAAEDSFKVGDQQFNAGSFMIKSEGNPADLRNSRSAVTELGLTARAVDKLGSEIHSSECRAPLHTWTNTQNEGWYRIELTVCDSPLVHLDRWYARRIFEKYDVVIFPPLADRFSNINGIPIRGGPIPWKQSD